MTTYNDFAISQIDAQYQDTMSDVLGLNEDLNIAESKGNMKVSAMIGLRLDELNAELDELEIILRDAYGA